MVAATTLWFSDRAEAQDRVIVVATNTYSAYRTDLAPGAWVYVDADSAGATPVRAMQRSLGYREVDYKSAVYPTLYFSAVTPTTNGAKIIYDYTTQANKTTNLVGFWAAKDAPVVIAPDGNPYIADGHHTTAGYLAPLSPVRQFVAGKNRVILGHVLGNYYDANAGPQPVTDEWWRVRAADNQALLYGPEGDQLTQPGEPNYAGLQPILPSVLAMPVSPSNITTNGATAMTPSVYRSLAWGLADAVVQSATDAAGKKIAGFKKTAPGNPADIFFVEFFWADYLRRRVVWDDSLPGSPLGSTNGDASATAAPLSFFTAAANGIALARSERYQDEYGRRIFDYTNAAVFPPNTVGWASGSLSNGLAVASDTYNLYLRDDSTIAGAIQPSALSTNILHIDTVAGLTVTQAIQNLRTIVVNGGGTLKTTWKDTTVINTTLRLPAGSGIVIITGTNTVAANTILGGGTLVIEGTLGGNLQVTNGILQGHGTVNGAVSVLVGGTLAPGAAIGTLTLNGSLSLDGNCVMGVNKTGAEFTTDSVDGITTLTYGGRLAIAATGDALAAGDAFKLFAASSYTSAFAALILPPLDPGLAWDTSRLIVDGTLRVVSGTVPLTLAAQPLTQTANVGTTVKLLGGAVGTGPIRYQWQFNGDELTGATGPSLTLPNIQKTNQGSYLFVASDSAGSVTSAVAILTVNRAPVAQGQSLSVLWNTPSTITLNASDPDGDAITFTVATQPTHGTLTGTAPSLTYQPAHNFLGADGFVYRISDGRLSSTATITLTVKPVALAVAMVTTNFLISWPQTSSTDTLQQAGALTPPPGTWLTVDGTPVGTAGRWQMTIPATGTNAFFRLRSP